MVLVDRHVILERGYATRHEVQAGLVSADELRRLGWLTDVATDNWATVDYVCSRTGETPEAVRKRFPGQG